MVRCPFASRHFSCTFWTVSFQEVEEKPMIGGT
jgi:hypothetical protein